MQVPTDHVQPGDLIRAGLLNDLVDFVAELHARVTELEVTAPPPGGNEVQILTVSPVSPRIGDQMTVTGRNFEYSLRAAGVRFDNTVVPAFKPASSDTQLIFDVPNIPGVGEGGREMTMKVSNFATEATRRITIQPRTQVFNGNIDIQYLETTPSPIAAGQNALVRFLARSTGTPAVAVVLSASVSTGWTGIAILDGSANAQPLPSDQLTVPALGEKPFVVRVPVPGGTPNATAFTLDVQAAGQGADAGRLTTLSVGQAGPKEDKDVKVDHRGVDGGALDGSRLKVKTLAKAEITLDAQFAQVGEYDITVTRAPAASEWKVVTDAPVPTDDDPSFVVESGDIQPDGWCHLQVIVEVTAPSDTSDQADLHVVAKRRGASLQSERPYQLVAVP